MDTSPLHQDVPLTPPLAAPAVPDDTTLAAPAKDETAPARDEAALCGMMIRQIRRRTKLTQIAFTRRYGIPLGTLRDWEQGRAKPDATARSYLALIAKAPEEIAALIGD